MPSSVDTTSVAEDTQADAEIANRNVVAEVFRIRYHYAKHERKHSKERIQRLLDASHKSSNVVINMKLKELSHRDIKYPQAHSTGAYARNEHYQGSGKIIYKKRGKAQ
jgi:hypothetical protein